MSRWLWQAIYEGNVSLKFQPDRISRLGGVARTHRIFTPIEQLFKLTPCSFGMILGSWVAVEVAVASYLRAELKFKISARSDKPFRRRSADRQTDRQTNKQTDRHPKFSRVTGVRGFAIAQPKNCY